MKYLVLGSNSFSGSNFCHYLIKQGDDVIAASRSPFKDAVFNPLFAHKNLFYQIDINNDQEKLLDILATNQIDVLVNFASQSMVGESWENPQHWYKTNVLSTTNLYDTIAREKSVKKLVHISTPEVYGSCEGYVSETQPFNPSTPYAVSRAAGDFHLRNLHKAYGLDYVLTRASNVYGPYQDLFRLIPKAIKAFAQKKRFYLHGGGKSRRNFIFMDDVSEATYLISSQDTREREYHISGKSIVPIFEVVNKIAEIMSVDATDLIETSSDRIGKDNAYILDSKTIQDEFGWNAKTDLEHGIKQTVDWFIDNQEKLIQSPDYYFHKE